MTSVPLHIPFIKSVAASALRVAVHLAVARTHVLSVDVVSTISLIYRFDFPARNTLKRPCVPYHIPEPDVLAEYPVKSFFKVRLRHTSLSPLNIAHNCGTLLHNRSGNY